MGCKIKRKVSSNLKIVKLILVSSWLQGQTESAIPNPERSKSKMTRLIERGVLDKEGGGDNKKNINDRVIVLAAWKMENCQIHVGCMLVAGSNRAA